MRKLWVLLVLVLFPTVAFTQTQPAPFCGVVDSFDYPIDNLVEGYDDFALYRPRFEGNHVGIDIGFDRWGAPVYAAAKGRVTLSDIEEWDTEKGVVVVEHTFPDGSIAYTLYGHMEETDDVKFPRVGQCVDQETVLGGIGWPSRGRPHLHYEIRDFMPDEGGPGYVTTNPLSEGWYHPIDFTHLWRIRLQPGFIESVTFNSVPALPPVRLDSGRYVLASGNVLEIVGEANGQVLGRLETDGVVSGLASLPGERVVAHTRNGQVFTLKDGRYTALWQVEGIDEPFLTLGETLVFAMTGGGLEAYDPAGALLWSLPSVATTNRVTQFTTNGQQIALGVRQDSGGILWRLIDTQGQVQYETSLQEQPIIAPAWDGSWIGLDGVQFKRFSNGENHTYGSIDIRPGRTAAATVDVLSNTYVYMGNFGNTLLAMSPTGEVLWQVEYPVEPDSLPPLMDTGNGCLLYTLGMDGILNVFDTSNGDLVNQVELYAGGDRNSSPRARILAVDQNETIRVGTGFLSVVALDGWVLGNKAASECLLG